MTTKLEPAPTELSTDGQAFKERYASLQEAAQAVFRGNLKVEGPKAGLITKLSGIMADLPTIEPEGYNKNQNYKFIKDTQILGALRPRFAKVNLVVIPDVIREETITRATKSGGESFLTKLWVNFTIIDGDTGQWMSGHGEGFGDDSGDKGANKAFTAALKNWLIKVFMIGGDADDIEADNATDEDASARAAGTARRTRRTVKTEDSTAEAEKGGRSKVTTAEQIREIAGLARGLGLGVDKTILGVNRILGDHLVVPENADDDTKSKVLIEYLQQLDPEDAGKVITTFRELTDRRKAAEAAEKSS